MPRLFLLDGTALAYRSHFALSRSGLTDGLGKPTGAVYGFTMTLRRILEVEHPELVAVAMDAPGRTFRHERFADYKATRRKAPDELLGQLEHIRAIVRAHGVPLFEIPGCEADDVIGTLARRGEEAGYEVFIVTGDKDFMQLVSDRVKLYNVFKPNVDLLIQGVDEVRERFGTDPAHVVDVLAVMGDASDNIPGVHGIGEKGAIKLIADFGSAPALLERLNEVPEKTRAKIEAARADLLLSLDLLRIDTHVRLDPPFESLTPPSPDAAALRDLFKRLDFKTLVDKVAAGAKPVETARDYVTVRDARGLDAMIAELRGLGRFVLDTETTSLFPLEAELVGLSFCGAEGRAFYVPCNAVPPVLPAKDEILARLAPLLTDPAVEIFGHNTKYDWLVLARHGLRLAPPSFDTTVASFCAAGASRRHGLDSLALQFFGLKKIAINELVGTGQKQISMSEVPIERVAEYACEDADYAWRVRAPLERELEENAAQKLFHELEMPLVPVLAAMEERGVRVDVAQLHAASAAMEAEIQKLVWDIQEIAGENVNVNSTKALGDVLFGKLRIHEGSGKRPARTKTGFATDAETLSLRYGDVPIVQKLLEYRELAKLKSTYVDALPRYVNSRTGRIHCSFSQVSAATGRLASSDPNLQNIPIRSERGRRLREAFVPREPDERGPWVLLSADYSQIELRLMAHLSHDPGLRRAFQAGEDIHAATASRIFDVMPGMVTREMRSQAKVINFGLLYGMGPARVARETGLSLPEARAFIERYFGAFPKVREWIDATLAKARETGYVETLLGRRRRTPDLNSRDARARVFAENAAVNTPVQGSAADIIKRAMIDLERELSSSSLGAELLLQVHDELVLEVPLAEIEETSALVRRCMEQAVALDVPLKVDLGYGSSWLEAH